LQLLPEARKKFQLEVVVVVAHPYAHQPIDSSNQESVRFALSLTILCHPSEVLDRICLRKASDQIHLTLRSSAVLERSQETVDEVIVGRVRLPLLQVGVHLRHLLTPLPSVLCSHLLAANLLRRQLHPLDDSVEDQLSLTI